jgi:hypothetical protein
MPQADVSVGELLDKFSILEIKAKLLRSELQLRNVLTEVASLKPSVMEYLNNPNIEKLYQNLKQVNLEIWEGMDEVFEIGPNPSPNYEPLCRHITKLNQDRSYIKKRIDLDSGSVLTEEKSYFVPNEDTK